MEEKKVVRLPVVYKAYMLTRGYVTVVENTDLFEITTGSVVLYGGKRIRISGVEKWKHLTDPPVDDSRQGIVTREPIGGKFVEIEL